MATETNLKYDDSVINFTFARNQELFTSSNLQIEQSVLKLQIF